MVSKIIERLRDERGSVGVLLALVIFTVVGMLFMTFNTAQLSKEKMRLQNAADSAALEHALWQARAMNALQNLNDEGYVTCQTAAVFLRVGAAIEGAAKAVAVIPPFGKIIAAGLRVGSTMAGGMSSIMSNIVLKFSIPISSFFYARIAVPVGYFSAQQFAYANGATPLLSSAEFLKGKIFGDMSCGIYAVGISPASPISTFVLPVVQSPMNKRPYKCDNKVPRGIFESAVGAFGTIYRTLHIGADWDFKPWVSKGGPYDNTSGSSGSKNKSSSSSTNSVSSSSSSSSSTNSVDGIERMIERGIEQRRQELAEYRRKRDEAEEEYRQAAAPIDLAKVEGSPPPTPAEQERFDKAQRRRDELRAEIQERGINPDVNVNSEEWKKEARAATCKELGIDDPANPKTKVADKQSGGSNSSSGGGTKVAQLPGATIWVAFKAKNSIHVLPLSAWSSKYSGGGLDKMPIIAIAAAKCITGDLIPHNKKSKKGQTNQRPSGFGVGATAKLVPIQRALSEFGNKTLAKVLTSTVGAVIYH